MNEKLQLILISQIVISRFFEVTICDLKK